MKSKIMKRAHQIAKTLIGDYYARLALALRQAWREARQMADTYTVNIKIQMAWFNEGMELIGGLKSLAVSHKYIPHKKIWEFQFPTPKANKELWKKIRNYMRDKNQLGYVYYCDEYGIPRK